MGTGMGAIVGDCALADQRVDIRHFHSDLPPQTESHLSANSERQGISAMADVFDQIPPTLLKICTLVFLFFSSPPSLVALDASASIPIDLFLLTPSEMSAPTHNANASPHNSSAPTHKADASQNNSSASMCKANASQYDSYAAYELAGRKMACLINPNFSPHTVLKVGVMDLCGCYEDIPMEQSEINQYLNIYHLMLRYVPWLEDELKIMDVPKFNKVANKLAKGMSEQCSMDLGSVKHAGLAYIPFNMNTTSALDPPLSKEWCSTIIALQTGAIPITTYNWPSFFYEDGVYDPQNWHRGLFCGHIAWWFYVHLFIGPSAAAKGVVTSNTAKRAKNCAWTLMEVTPHIITYVHIIKWTNTTGSINLAEMAWTIVDMFENRDEWMCEMLHWWNICAFLHRAQNGSRSLKHCLEPESDDDVMHICTKCGSTIGSNTSSAGSSGTFGNDVSSNHALQHWVTCQYQLQLQHAHYWDL
ncbi:hypothetical protein EDC04DRAFT_2601030 [Pisolithus marmoratus]|nr:hypothetical protein EDC04DRAFT_2601030 [Pisolithus marmoratus]